MPGRDIALPDGTPVTLGIRPEHCELGNGAFDVTVVSTEVLGAETVIHAASSAGTPFTVSRRGISRARQGDRVSVQFGQAFVHLFDEAGRTVGANTDWRNAYLN